MVDQLKRQPLAPLDAEWLLVQSNGMRDWLELGLASDAGLGICAATRIQLPGAAVWSLYRAVLGARALPPQSPFDKTELLWRLVRLLPVLVPGDSVYGQLSSYLADDRDGRKLYQLAREVADVFDGYQNYRADWLADWSAGRDVLRKENDAAADRVPLDANQLWQAKLWRAVQEDIAEEGDCNLAARGQVHRLFVKRLRGLAGDPSSAAARATLPSRIVVFGVSSLPPDTLEALTLMGSYCQVLFFVLAPCRHDMLRVSHPLLDSWGQQGREYLQLLGAAQGAPAARREDAFVDPLSLARPSLLAQLQSGIYDGRAAAGAALAPGDDSVTLAMAHSPQREVEVLHDRLLAWFDADARLQPADVIVMVPDMEKFAPHIQAVFNRFGGGQPRHIPFSVADLTQRRSALLLAFEQLLLLPASRLTLTDWVALFEVPALRRRFGLDEVDVAHLRDWLDGAGVRWGLDAGHREQWGFPALPDGGADQNTWIFGLKRLLLGYAAGTAGSWQGIEPHAALGGLDARVVSALLDWVAAIDTSLRELAGRRTADDWCLNVGRLAERFFAPADDAEMRLITTVRSSLEAWGASCRRACPDTLLPLVVVREHLLSRISEPGLAQGFFGGGVQFASLMPMRAIPYKVVCLLGMNDAAFPRRVAPRDFDLMAGGRRAGDRSRREDDRTMFLEALLAAREKLYISWQGRRAADNAVLPPSVLVAQLLDFLQEHWPAAPRPQLQPLQPFSASYFTPGSGFATYADDWARLHGSQGGPAIAGTAVSAMPPVALTGTHLKQLLRQPVQVFYRHRLGVWLDGQDDGGQDTEPFAPDPLALYAAGKSLLDAEDVGLALAAMARSGTLPLAGFGERLGAELRAKADVVLERRARWWARYPQPLLPYTIALALAGGAPGTDITLAATLVGLRADGEGRGWLQLVERPGALLEGQEGAKQPKWRHLAGAWGDHLMACAGGVALTTVLLGVDTEIRWGPLPATQARELLDGLWRAYQAAWAAPLALACDTGCAWLQASRDSLRPGAGEIDPLEVARKAFDGDGRHPGERAREAYLAVAFADFGQIARELPAWAERLYGAMVRHTAIVHGLENRLETA